jgi:hypothetical protein
MLIASLRNLNCFLNVHVKLMINEVIIRENSPLVFNQIKSEYIHRLSEFHTRLQRHEASRKICDRLLKIWRS